MPKREEREPRLEEEAQVYREQAERHVTASILDGDPIKQYVRQFGWLQIIQDYMERRRNDGIDRPLKYLSVPGPNAYDIGLLYKAGVLTRTDDGFPHVAICDRTSAEQVVANLGILLGYSSQWLHVAVRGPKSELASLFPFDVINMDISQPVISGSSTRSRALRNLAAIRWMFRLQRGQSFLLLLTTLPDEAARGMLEGVLRDNLNNEEKFRQAYCGRYGSLIADHCMQDYVAFTQLVLPKIIARIARDLGYASREHFAAKYGREIKEGETYNLVCHSFEFEPLGMKNPAMKYRSRFRNIPEDEVSDELSTRVRIHSIRAYEDFLPTLILRDSLDIEARLRESADLKAGLTGEAQSLTNWWKSDESQLGANSEIH